MRKVILCDKYGSKNIEVENVELGYEYDLISPIKIKDTDGKVRDTVIKVVFESEPTRGDQKRWSKFSDDDQIDEMIISLTSLEKVHIDYIGLKDLVNISELINCFLPEDLMKETEN